MISFNFNVSLIEKVCSAILSDQFTIRSASLIEVLPLDLCILFLSIEFKSIIRFQKTLTIQNFSLSTNFLESILKTVFDLSDIFLLNLFAKNNLK